MLVGFLSFLWVLCAIAFSVLLVLLIIWLVRKKSWKPFLIATVSVFICFIGLPVAIVALYVPVEKPESVAADSEPTEDEQPEISTEETTTAGITTTTTASAAPETAESSTAHIVTATTTTTPVITTTSTPVVTTTTTPAVTTTSISTTEATTPAPSEAEPDLVLIRSLFDALISEYEGAIVSIESRTIDGEVFSWSIIDVVVPDAWYYLEEYQKNRYCQNVGNYVKAAVITGGVAKDEFGVSVYFYDVAGLEVAKSKMFGGYNLT